MSSAPRILCTTWRRQGRTFGPPLRDMYGAEVQYVHALQRAGAVVFLAPQPTNDTDATAAIAGFDGLVAIGGEDLAAEVSGADPETIGENASADRDRWELALIGAALRADVPLLAVCRGMQLLNVGLGGTLVGEISGSSPEHPPVPSDTERALAYRHQVTFSPDSLAARCYGLPAKPTNSLHHQAIDTVGAGLVVTGRADDGVVEALELPGHRWCLGIQWHPELMPDDPLEAGVFTAFLEACTR